MTTVAALRDGRVSRTVTAPDGGANHSGMGREGGIAGIRDCPNVKSCQMVWA
jgi:acyl-CoA reductase-like NAD-dependent aldehyde dehydrogenase